jgi:glutathione S-transferase
VSAPVEGAPLELFWGSGSTPAWRALLGLHIKGLPYTGHLLSFSARETRSPEFLALNPRGKVPTLRHGGVVLAESLAILAYLDRLAPSPPIFGDSAAAHGTVWRACLDFENVAGPAISLLVRPLLFGAAPEVGSLDVVVPGVVDELDRLAAAVHERAAIVGDDLSAADLVWYCAVRYLERALTRPAAEAHALGLWPLGARWPALLPWAARIEAIPGFDQTFPPHWREGTAPLGLQLA